MIRKTLRLLGNSRRHRWVLVVLLAVVGSFLEVVGAVLILLLLGLIVDPETEIALPVIGELQFLSDPGERETLLIVAAIGGFFLVRALVSLLETYVQQRVIHQAGVRLAAQLFEGYLSMPYVWHLQRRSAGLMRNVHEAVNTLVRQVFLPVIRVGAESLMLVALVTVLFIASPFGTLLAVAVLGPLVFLLVRVVQPALKRYGRTTHQAVASYFSTLQQSLAGIRDLKVLGRERFFARQFVVERSESARAGYLQGTLGELPRVLVETSLLLFILGFFALSIVRGESAGGLLPVLGLFAYATLRMQPSIQKIVAGINSLRFATAAVDEVYGELDTLRRAGALTRTPPDEPLDFEHQISFEDLSFRYDNTPAPAITNVNLEILKGESIGICGPTGGGKTTLVDLLIGLLEPTSGSVRVDGRDIRHDARRWQQNLGVVPQTVFILDDTLRRNIAFGLPDDEIDDGTVAEAVELAQLATFVASLPNGLDTQLGERGVLISGGERQRVAIARALYRRPSVLVFDEGTSALDNVTEAALIRMIDRIRGDRTIVVVAHRLTTVRKCDRIFLVVDGRISDIGDFDDLLTRSTEFRKLAELT